MCSRADARTACHQVGDLLRHNPHVTGVGIAPGAGGWSVKVNLDRDDDRTRRQVPARVDGVPVVVEVVGRCRSLTHVG